MGLVFPVWLIYSPTMIDIHTTLELDSYRQIYIFLLFSHKPESDCLHRCCTDRGRRSASNPDVEWPLTPPSGPDEPQEDVHPLGWIRYSRHSGLCFRTSLYRLVLSVFKNGAHLGAHAWCVDRAHEPGCESFRGIHHNQDGCGDAWPSPFLIPSLAPPCPKTCSFLY
jgi:hypothetical protein